MPAPRHIVLNPEERSGLEGLVRSGKTPQRLVERVRIILLADQGKTNIQIAKGLVISQQKTARWRNRYIEGGLRAIEKDKTRSGRRPKLTQDQVQTILDTTLHEAPPTGETHWSTRTLGRHLGVSHYMVHRVWRAHNLKPHLIKTFKMSNDPAFVEKLRDVVGLYMNPPENAVVISVDEKTQCQALERTQQRVLNFDRPASMSYDYKRHGTTTLFAGLNVLTGKLTHMTRRHHRHTEWLDFLRMIDREVDSDLDVHIICDNYCTHKHKKVQRWIGRHPRFHMHFTPTSASWLNMVERFFSHITEKHIRRGSFKSVRALEKAIHKACEAQNEIATPYMWTKKADEILAKLHL